MEDMQRRIDRGDIQQEKQDSIKVRQCGFDCAYPQRATISYGLCIDRANL